MSFTANHVEGTALNNKNKNIPLIPNQLNIKELEVLISLIRKSTFSGEDIEPIYNMVIKLQNQYLEQTK
jgi:hypothetical protein